MIYRLRYLIVLVCLMLSAVGQSASAASEQQKSDEFNVNEFVLDHLADSYEWHITTINDKHISIPLPVIVRGETSGWHLFLSSKFHSNDHSYNGFYIAKEGEYRNKIVERNAAGEEVRPFDLSLTKNSASIIITSILLVIVILSVTSWYRKQGAINESKAPKGFVGAMELFIMSVQDDIIKPCVGKNYRKFSPYLLTVFFFIFFSNVLGLIPIFPGGANATGNISVTLVLAMFTFVIVNLFGTKEYYREIFWPDVPTWLKVPIPIMPFLELIGVFTKPFALTIRLFANILAGHSIILGLTCLIFVTVSMGAALNSSMTVLSVFLSVFVGLVEILVAYIQAYVFTMLSSIFIGLAQVEPHKAH